MKTLTEKNFEATINQTSLPVLVDFAAEWCGPCKMLSPVLEDLAREHTNTAVIAKVDIDQSPKLAAKYQVTSIPTLIAYKHGKPQLTMQGLQSKSRLNRAIDQLA